MKLYKTSRNNVVTAIALLCKVFVGASIVILASLVATPVVFGQYAKLVSAALVLGAVFDFGISLRSLAVPRDNTEELKSLYRFVLVRDLGLVALCLCFIGILGVSYLVVIAAILGGHLISVQSHARASGDYYFELIVNSLMALINVLAFLAFYLFKWNVDANSLILYFLVVPRLFGSAVCIWYFHRQEILIKTMFKFSLSACRQFFCRLRSLVPFAAQGILVASATNVDVLVASYVMPVADVGRIKLITTVVGLLLMAPEILANIWLNKLANQNNLQSGIGKIERMFGYLGAALFVIGFPLFFFFSVKNLNGASYYPFLIALILSLVVALRVGSLSWATIFTVVNLQHLRLSILIVSSFAYWLGVLAFGHSFGINGFIGALLFMSILQLALYYSFGSRRLSKLID